MQQHYFRKTAFKSLFSLILAICVCSISYAQTLVVGNIGTSATSQNGTAAPAGKIWHELQTVGGVSNTTLASSHASFSTNDFALAEDFTVPAGPSWNLTTIRFYALDQTGSATSGYTNIRVRIYNGVPGAGGTIVFGDMTTNRFAATGTTNKQAIFSTSGSAAAPTPNIPIHFIDANVPVTLAPGTYWVEWQVVFTANTFSPVSQTLGSLTTPGANARQRSAAVWTALTDGTTLNPTALAMNINYNTSACSGTPAPGNTVTSAASVCPGIPFTLSPQNATNGSGVTYQWQSASAVGGPYTNIAGATSATYTVTNLTVNTYYQVTVTCGGNNGITTPVLVSATPASACYCIPATSDCTDGDIITNVTFGTLNNNSTCGTNGFTDYTTNNTVTIPNVIAGGGNPISVIAGDGGFSENVAVWIDYNKNGVFEASEFTLLTPTTATPTLRTGSIVVPAGATLGNTRMRVRVRFSTLQTGADACTTYTYGETEDYTVNIVPCTPIAITGAPVNATISCGGNASFTVTVTGSIPAYQWEYRTSASAAWQLITAATSPVYSGINTATLQLTSAPVSFNGYQYRAIVSGACTGPDFSSAATLTVNPFTLAVTPASGNVCSTGGTPILLTVPNNTNVATSTNSTSGIIPDPSTNTTAVANAGITRNFTISGVSGSVLSAKVTLNITHPYVSDVVISLKAPNGQILNLDYVLNSTGNPGANFINTVIGSTYTLALDGSAAPHTNNHKADAVITPTFVGVATGATGFLATTTTWASLFSVPNGTWTMSMYDAGATDEGTFNNATLEITYGSAPATAVFTPVTGLYTNAAATTPYTGTAVSQVYALPTATTTYNAVVSTATCSAAPQSIVISVNTPVTGTPTVANKATCAGTDATFTVAGITGGTGATYQWQVSTAGGPFTNITGATSATYTVTAPTTAQNGNQYLVKITSAGCAATTTLTSTAGTLTVNATPVVVISAAPSTSITPGSTVTLTAATSPSAAASYQWYNNGVAVAGATSNTLVVGINGVGSYTVKVTDINGCSNTALASTPASIQVTGAQTNQLFIYPSPNTGKFQVRYFNDLNDGINAPAILTVHDSKGSLVFTRRYTLGAGYQAMQVDLASHGKGVYRVELLNTNGERLKTGNVLVY